MSALRAIVVAALAGVALAPAACFVELDESLWQSRGTDGAKPEEPAQGPSLADSDAAVDVASAVTAADAGPTAADAGVGRTADQASPAADAELLLDGLPGADLAADGDDLGSAPTPDATAPDLPPPPDQGTVCSAAGVPAQCDPLTGGGCAAGTCYLSPVGTRCVCPSGTLSKGDTCTTTTQCAPGLVCAASQTKGVCRELCDRTDPECPPGEWCVSISDVALFGICRK